MAQLRTTTIPTVLFDNYITKNPNVAYVGTDSFEGIDLAIDHLTELGHTKIALLNGSPDSMVTSNRYDAYASSMQSHKLELDENLVAFGHYVEDSAKYHLPALIENGATAIICGNDLLAVGVIRECGRLHIKIPQEISVVGFDNLPISEEITPAPDYDQSGPDRSWPQLLRCALLADCKGAHLTIDAETAPDCARDSTCQIS